MSNFFSALSSIEGKIKHQEYKIKILSEEFNVLVPFSNKVQFLEMIQSQEPKTKDDVINILTQFNGRLED